jgi:hypothetical protein
VVTTAGKPTYGLARVWARLSRPVVPGLSCFALAGGSAQDRRSCPSRVEQSARRAAENTASRANAAAKPPPPPTTRRGPGRPQGRQNHVGAAVTRTPEVLRSRRRLDAVRHLIPPAIPWPALVREGPWGHHHAWPMAPQCRGHLISQVRSDAAGEGPSAGAAAGRGPPRQSGSKLADRSLPAPYLQATPGDGPLQPRLYQAHRLHPAFPPALPGLIRVKPPRQPHAAAPVVRGSRALEPPYAQRKRLASCVSSARGTQPAASSI